VDPTFKTAVIQGSWGFITGWALLVTACALLIYGGIEYFIVTSFHATGNTGYVIVALTSFFVSLGYANYFAIGDEMRHYRQDMRDQLANAFPVSPYKA